MLRAVLLSSLLLFVSACSDAKKNPKGSASSGMKCGAGKCGANMFDGKGALAKKKKNILAQMREGDPRKGCVVDAKNTKALYDCVRSPKTQRMSLKCGDAKEQEKMPSMKCGAGKCGASMQEQKPEETMKCGAGKCGSSMN